MEAEMKKDKLPIITKADWQDILGKGLAWKAGAVAKKLSHRPEKPRTLIRDGIKHKFIRSRMTTVYYDSGSRPERVRVYELIW